MKKILLFLSALFALLYTYGQAISLDSSFAGKGWTYTDFTKGNNYYESALQVLPQEGSSYLVLVDAGNNTLLARYLLNGTLDKSFGTEGFSELADMLPIKAARQADGQIVVAGHIYSSAGFDFTLVRYHPDGTLDQSFGNKGIVTTDLEGDDMVSSVAIQPDGRIVVAGSTIKKIYPQYSDFALVRYLADGSLDGSFGSGGKVITDFSGGDDAANSVALQEDGKILTAGRTYNPTTKYAVFALARYNPDGTLDGSFDGDGIMFTDFYGKADKATSLAIQEDRKIVAAGRAYNPTTNNAVFALARYNPDGTLDGSFGSSGKVTTDFSGGDDAAVDLAIQQDGKIVAAGNSNDQDFALARYNPDGTLDNSFDGDGKLTTDLGEVETAISLLLQEDGRMVVAGRTYNWNDADFVLARYTPDGSPDNSFDGDGVLSGFYPVAASHINTVAVQQDGKVVVAGRTNDHSYNMSDFGLARYNVDGSPDLSFGNKGTVVTDFLGDNDIAYAIAIQSDGKIVVAGEAVSGLVTKHNHFGLARYNPDGSLDSSFGEDGKVTTEFWGINDYANTVALQEDGKIVVAGRTYNPGSTHVDFGLVRYNKDGSPDASFGNQGKVTTDFGANEEAISLVVQSDGRLVVAGNSQNIFTARSYFALARYNTDGSLDNTFDADGKLTTEFFGTENLASGLVVQSDGKLVAAGTARYASGYKGYFALARYNTDGSADSSFNGDGKLVTGFGDSRGFGSSLVLQRNGKLLMIGNIQSFDYNNVDLALVRYNADGVLDTTFGSGGLLIQDFGYLSFGLSSCLYQNRFFVAGTNSAAANRGVIAAYRFDCMDKEICGNRVDDNCDGQVDEGCANTPFLTINDVTVSEDLQRATLMVMLSKKAEEPIQVSYFTVDRTAVSNVHKGIPDYEAKSGTLTIPAGQQTAVISINIFQDNLAEGEEFFDVHLQRPVHAALSGDKARVIIKDAQAGNDVPLLTHPVAGEEQPAAPTTLVLKAQPNPSAASFTVLVQSPGNTPVVLKVSDATGRLVEVKTGIAPHTTLQLGQSWRPGVYYLEAVQGNERVDLKLVKQAY